jgi:hypothetical protein
MTDFLPVSVSMYVPVSVFLHRILSYLTLMKKRIPSVFVKGIFGYLLMASFKVDTYNYVPASITGSFSFTGSLVVNSKSSCALTKCQSKKKLIFMEATKCSLHLYVTRFVA